MIIRALTCFLLASSLNLYADNNASQANTPESDPHYFNPDDREHMDADKLDPTPPNHGVAKTIQDALRGAYENNPAILQTRRAVIAAQERVVQAYAEFMPVADLQAGVSKSQTMNSGNSKNGDISAPTTSGVDGYSRQGGLTITQNLFKGGASMAGLRGADSYTRSAWAQARETEQDQLMQVIEAFLELIRLKKERKALEGNVLAVKTNLQAAQSKLNIGEETKTQVAIAEAQLADAEAKLQNSIAHYGAAEAAFYALTGLKPADELETPSITAEVPQDLNYIISEARTNNPTVIRTNYDYDVAKSEIAKNKGANLLPSVDLQGSTTRNEGINHYNSIMNDKDTRSRDNTTNNKVTLNVKYNLFDGGASRSKDRELYQSSAAKRVAIEGARMKAHQDAVKAKQNQLAALRNIRNYLTQVNANTTSLDGTKQEMAVGTKILYDVLVRQGELLNAELNLSAAEKTALLEAFKVLAAMGRVNVDLLKLPVKKFDAEREYGLLIQN